MRMRMCICVDVVVVVVVVMVMWWWWWREGGTRSKLANRLKGWMAEIGRNEY